MDVLRVGQVPTYVTDGVTNHVLLRWGTFDARNLLVMWTVMRPRGQQRGHAHAGSEQLYVILSGKARMQVRDERQVLSGGAAVYVPPSTPHSIANAGTDDLVYITAASPPFPVERFFAETGAREVSPESLGEPEAAYA